LKGEAIIPKEEKGKGMDPRGLCMGKRGFHIRRKERWGTSKPVQVVWCEGEREGEGIQPFYLEGGRK